MCLEKCGISRSTTIPTTVFTDWTRDPLNIKLQQRSPGELKQQILQFMVVINMKYCSPPSYWGGGRQTDTSNLANPKLCLWPNSIKSVFFTHSL